MAENNRRRLLVGRHREASRRWLWLALFLFLAGPVLLYVVPSLELFLGLPLALAVIEAYTNDGVVVCWALGTAVSFWSAMGGIPTQLTPELAVLVGFSLATGMLIGLVVGVGGFIGGKVLQRVFPRQQTRINELSH